MNNYHIERIHIENFKLIDKLTQSLSWNGYDLIMLDGPNGFGKTTIFDVIELVLTGKIKRILLDDGRITYKQDLLRKDPSKKCELKIKFVNKSDGSCFTISKKFNEAEKSYKADNLFNFDTFLLESFECEESKYIPIDQAYINDLFSVEDINRFYNLFYYVQQEDNTYFLKQKAKDRMDAISHLFDTKVEQDQRKSINDLHLTLRQELTKVNKSIKEKNSEISKLNEIVPSANTSNDNLQPYFKLLSNLENPKPWDLESPTITNRDAYNHIIDEIKLIGDFARHFDMFIKAKSNTQIDNLIKQKDLIKETILFYHHLESYEAIKELHEKQKSLQDFRTKFSRDSFLKNPVKSITNDMIKFFDVPLNLETINALLKEIQIEKSNASDLENLIRELNLSRDQVSLKFKELLDKHDTIDAKNCPLCGAAWFDYQELLGEINKKQDLFISLYTSTNNRLDELFNTLFDNHLTNALFWVSEYLNKKENLIDDDFIERFKKNIVNKSKYENFVAWCVKKNISIIEVCSKDRQLIENIQTIVGEITDLLLKLRYQIEDNYDSKGSQHIDFKRIYKDIFSENSDQVLEIKQDHITNKIKYIDHIFFSSRAIELSKVTIALKQLQDKRDAIVKKNIELKKIIDEYDRAIKQHWNKIMKDIEIPFYIYSGKIIQYYQKGLGIFIKESKNGEAKTIKFVSHDFSEHDAVNYFSSGQLSALVLSFTLSLNKVYGNTGLGLILIDDPVQAMDEINMASLTELLRNEFDDKQIILSTHEEDVSRYIRYKFNKYGKSTHRFSVKHDFHFLMGTN
ncbi:AAA family ATPase [Paenibacillus sp. NPDC057934]|uniref:ATP-binding protein n=1 Tax=Paenibacillus sp. NPDC057934 TaxID=3346282 RepID=UPI0036DE6504